MQKKIYNEIGLKPTHFNKLEKGLVNPSNDILEKLASYYDVTIDELIHYNNATPKAVTVEDKTAIKQVRLIAQLNEKNKSNVTKIIDTILTKQKFENFFEQNIAVN